MPCARPATNQGKTSCLPGHCNGCAFAPLVLGWVKHLADGDLAIAELPSPCAHILIYLDFVYITVSDVQYFPIRCSVTGIVTLHPVRTMPSATGAINCLDFYKL
jgi:hypothetical protein